ncbi:hypothetical protein FLK61_35300 [Paenalkalicoccus suaedae]|uniref:Uncharacterized protein n=1 Tax=Paenalkalicoccus suaedae TaxID=2592382 RepID=A0A859FIB0_9BACI|nr:hypothetical protein [Paenalkalicoccus suaedae]QKS71936.1 hypothetical protein FLK61_35300 [Paenalkalicoccus suaedae]
MPINTVSGEVRVFCGAQSQVNEFLFENPDLEVLDIQMSSGSSFVKIMVIYRPEE